MQLNKLEIKGFKSFGDKVTIHFNEGITAIVGPNGCGKSNVVDAIRWVLGEKSTKMLRSEKMENIIFNGTKTRKPAQLAEVSLSFDNTKNILPTEFSSVTITRKLYRTGESEYRLNDVKCRLKDITDLFLDTGIGADSYSIIELKMIDEIINNNDHSRRNLFEEASGVSKYKVRKKQTLTKLLDTEADLSRIEDLLYEINKNLKTLENQARKAEQYILIKEKYKETSIRLAKHNLLEFQNKLQDITTKDQTQQDAIIVLQTQISQDEAALQRIKLNLITKEKNLSLQQKATQENLHQIRTYESEKKIKNQQMQHLQERCAKLQEELKSDSQQYQHVLYKLKRLAEELHTEETQLQNLTQQLEALKLSMEELRMQQHEAKAQLDRAASQTKTTQQEVDHIEKELTIMEIQKQALLQEYERNTSDTQSRASEIAIFSTKIEELADNIESLAEQHQSLVDQEAVLTQNRYKEEDKLALLKEESAKHVRLLDAKKNEYALTKSLVENLEGFPESIRFLQKNAGWKVPFPLFSDILFCEEKYRIAIENFLEPIMNHYVVDTAQEALQAIELLKNASKGRAHFFVLSSISPISSIQAPLPQLIPLSEFVTYDDKYQPLIHNLLNGIFISNSSNLDLLHPYKGITILQENGNLTISPLSISGGSIGLFEGKRIGRAKNLEFLAKEIKNLHSLIDQNNSTIEGLTNNINSLKNTSQKSYIEELQLQINHLNKEYIALKTKQEQHTSFMEESASRKDIIHSKLTDIDMNIAKHSQMIQAYKQTLRDQQDTLSNVNENFTLISEQTVNQSTIFNQKNLALYQQQNKVSSIQKDIEYREAQQETYESRLKKNEKELQEVQFLMKEATHYVDHNDVELLALYSTKETLEEGLKDLEEDYHAEKKLIHDLEGVISAARQNKDQLMAIAAKFQEERTNLKIELNALKERLAIEFSIDIETLLNDLEEYLPQQIEELITNKELLKKKLAEFGSVNSMAKEAYDEMLTRFNFIEKEKEDLVQAKDSLLHTIKEIDETANQKFMESFNSVRANFIEVFRSLFNEEDNCDLILTNPEHPLESDIDIIARPKGKRPLSINQLSGGEKTLTATALLFSLYLQKPAPFCIFDEVDAPLDDTNIDKFNHIIRQFSDRSQFIVVSHNKRTIASTDIIYGVTMVEQGISRVVAVDLRDVA